MLPSGHRRGHISRTAAAQAAAVYAQAEIALLTALAAAVRAALTGTLSDRQAGQRLRVQAVAVTGNLEPLSRQIVAQAARDIRGDVQAALREDLGIASLPLIPLTALARLTADLRQSQSAAVQWVMAQYQQIIAQSRAAPPPPLAVAGGTGTAGLLAAAQVALDAAALTGVVAFVTAAGARLSLAAYAALAAAAAVARQHLQMQLQGFRQAGIALVYVWRESAAPPCPKCAPYVHTVLSLTPGTAGPVSVRIAGGTVKTVTVTASLAQAMAAGLFHPNCRDSARPFADGMHITPQGLPPGWAQNQARAYAAQQTRRRRARHRHAAARHAAVAISAKARAAARRLARHLRAG